ncbi:hypothetical protein [Paludibaculum fermentans]|uniref:hypothetical protein n=1 Tax=Paludibaculum fermentans TaxID=1473598 RepID=UPI003EB9ABA3
MLVRELFPELAKQVLRDLRTLRRNDLAAEVMNLRVEDRCRCGAAMCGTFYTQGADFRKRMGTNGIAIMLECGATVTEAKGRIVEIETLDPHITEMLSRVIP